MSQSKNVTLEDLARYIHQVHPEYFLKDILAILYTEQEGIELSLLSDQKVKWGDSLTFQMANVGGKGKRWDFNKKKMVPKRTRRVVKIELLKRLQKLNGYALDEKNPS